MAGIQSETLAEEKARIKAILSSGAASVAVDGVPVTVDRDALRRRLREIDAVDDVTGVQRPVIQKVWLGGW